MNRKFDVTEIVEINESPFDRQQRITWWDQEKLSQAKILVVGAGAIGNETLKNLALLGIGNIYIVDFDTVSTSNLSRTVLFRKNDEGRQKAEVAALRTKDMALNQEANISWFHGDAVWELGSGIFREMDLVLGCLDNVETRFFVNRQCWLVETPWIDAGIYELGGHVSTFIPPDSSCYQCNSSKEQLAAARRRYSCDDFKRTLLDEGKMPTVQVTSSLVSSIQVQEAIKILCGQEVKSGKKIYFQGKTNDFDIINLPKNNHCTAHVSFPDVISLHVGNSVTLRSFLELVSHDHLSGAGATLDYRGDRTFVLSVSCKQCGKRIELNKPSFRIFDHEASCYNCTEGNLSASPSGNSESPSSKKTVSDFSLDSSSDELLDMSLRQLGIPCRHILAVHDKSNSYKYYELSQDSPFTQV
jgi:molybdopterin-synthase adenylyltransferase